MIEPKLAHAIDLYIDGVTGGDLQATVDKCITGGFRQHTPGIGGGRVGLLAAWQPLVERYDRRYIQPLRGFVDGTAVALHTFQSFGYREIERVVFDVLDTDAEDRITSQWSVSAPLVPVSQCGYSQIDGPHLIDDTHATATNKQIVGAYTAARAAGRPGRAAAYLAGPFVDHHPLPDAERPGHRTDSGRQRVVRLLGSGNMVAVLSVALAGGTARHACDLYLLRDGLITERWNVTQLVRASAAWDPSLRTTVPWKPRLRRTPVPAVGRRLPWAPTPPRATYLHAWTQRHG